MMKMKFTSYFINLCRRIFCNSIVSHNLNTKATNGTKDVSEKILSGPSLSHFMNKISHLKVSDEGNSVQNPYIVKSICENKGRKVYIETYGCQMNVNDTEIIHAILEEDGFQITKDEADSDVVFVVTCSIREGAEQKIWNRLRHFKSLKRRRSANHPLYVGVLGCMAERLKHKLLEKERLVDIVAGPDSYRDLPNLLSLANEGQEAVNVMLSVDETYADIVPVRMNPESKTAFVSIMRGCDNLCTYCIVPFTRGNERSRPVSSILEEVQYLSDQGFKEVTLLGQNVNSYRDLCEQNKTSMSTSNPNYSLSKGFVSIYKNRANGLHFADLLEKVAAINPEMRIRFTSPHPKDFPDPVLQVIKHNANICKLIHLPAQSGNTEVLQRMRRGHTREAYLELVEHIREVIPGIAFTSDFISGFCGESEVAHEDTLSLIEKVKYVYAYTFPYSMRNKTAAYHTLEDDVPVDVKKRRSVEVQNTFRKNALELHRKERCKEHLVLVSGPSKRSESEWYGRNDWNTKVIFPCTAIPASCESVENIVPKVGDYIVVKITDCSSEVLKGRAIYCTSLQQFENRHKVECEAI